MAYFVLEIQKWCDGTWHHIMYQYDNRQSAESKYYYILSEAVLAQIPRNGAVLIDGNGQTLMSNVIQHGEYEGYVPPVEDAE